MGAAYVVRVEMSEQFLGVSSPLLPCDSWALTLRWPGLVAGGLACICLLQNDFLNVPAIHK